MMERIFIVFQDNSILPCTAFGIFCLLSQSFVELSSPICFTMSSSFFEHASYIKQVKVEI